MKLQEQIRQLSDRLGHDPGERDRLLASLAGHTPSALIKVSPVAQLDLTPYVLTSIT